MKLANMIFEVFNTDRTKNREVTQFVLLKVEINEHKEQINAVVINLNSMDVMVHLDTNTFLFFYLFSFDFFFTFSFSFLFFYFYMTMKRHVTAVT